jgi:hypothetical protein
MPNIDVTDLLFDLDIAGETFQVVRRRQVVNAFGETQLLSITYNAIGQIAPAARTYLERTEGYTSQQKDIQVITTFKLFGPSKDGAHNLYEPDLIFWKNGFFICNKVEDYSQYGAGMVAATCEAFDWTVQATSGPTAGIINRELVGKSFNIAIISM